MYVSARQRNTVYVSARQRNTVYVAGNATLYVAGNATLYVVGNATLYVVGNATLCTWQATQHCTWQATQHCTWQATQHCTWQATQHCVCGRQRNGTGRTARRCQSVCRHTISITAHKYIIADQTDCMVAPRALAVPLEHVSDAHFVAHHTKRNQQ